jgi:hypothetical protein
MENRSEILTEDGLVARLCGLGYDRANKRWVASLRANELFQQFNVKGRGRGRGPGRECSGWSDSEGVLKRAVQVCELFRIYGRLGDLHLPLWMMGYNVPLERVREAISLPLEIASSEVEVMDEESGRPATEDVIDEEASKFTELIQRADLKFPDVHKEILETFANLFLNSDYPLWDQPFEDGVKAQQELDQTIQQRCDEIFGDSLPESSPQSKSSDAIWTVFTHATFINEHLSLRPLREAVNTCSDEDLMIVQRDLQIVLMLAHRLKRLLAPLKPYLPAGLELTLDDDGWRAVFKTGLLCIWADLSLRRSGYGAQIDQYLAGALAMTEIEFDHIERQISEEFQQEGAGASVTLIVEAIAREFGITLPLGGDAAVANATQCL